jgi:hypothetical protein
MVAGAPHQGSVAETCRGCSYNTREKHYVEVGCGREAKHPVPEVAEEYSVGDIITFLLQQVTKTSKLTSFIEVCGRYLQAQASEDPQQLLRGVRRQRWMPVREKLIAVQTQSCDRRRPVRGGF